MEGVTLGAAGINYAEFDADERRLQILDGGPFQRPDDIIIDDYYADQKKARVGDTITLLNSQMARLRHHGERQALAHRAAPSTPCRSATATSATSTRSM